MPSDASGFRIQFHDCVAGWIRMDVCHGTSSLSVNLSHVYEPLPSMLAWLESVVVGVDASSFEIDEEGSTVRFCSALRGDGLISLTVIPSSGVSPLEFSISRRELVGTFYASIVTFSESADYKPEEWELHTLEDALREGLGISPLTWIESVVALDRRGVQKAIWVLDQSRYVDTDLARSCGTYATDIEVLELTDASATPGELLSFWPLEEWESMVSRDERVKFLEECLNEKSNRSWDGCPWAKMRSSLIESWLSSNDVDMAWAWKKWLVPG